MLESMIDSPIPTRAEANDVANAILDGTDAVMLSGETTIGKYPVEAVKMMSKIAKEVETNPLYEEMFSFHMDRNSKHTQSWVQSQREILITRTFNEMPIKAIIAITTNGNTVQLLSKAKVVHPIIALCPNEALACRLSMWWGVIPLLLDKPLNFSDNIIPPAAMQEILGELLTRTFLKKGDRVVFVAGLPYFSLGKTTFVKHIEL